MMHGGYAEGQQLSDSNRIVFNALVDTLIPPEDGWPPAREISLAELASRYLVPDDSEISFYPHFRTTEFFSVLDEEAPELRGENDSQRVVGLTRFEAINPKLFSRVRDFVYYLYYGHPDVVELIRQHTKYGPGFHGRPQPIGYEAVLENWGTRPLTNRGAFIPTDSIFRAPQAAQKDRANS
ncbi:hypothetical protein [Paramicrobacterium chengjingii]|uniref:hypothetical protein n=1 Tax=Paramicrobacterium chengjingii TaxID=2769067 RepID=UPI001AB02879|nr:hypothetical protein [Microbacterium chengjingii]